MKQIIILAIGAVILLGAIAISAKQGPKKDRESIYAPMSCSVTNGYHTIVIDSCEYIEGYNRLAHKGNCKFCNERHIKHKEK